MAVELLIQAPLELAFVDVLNAIHEGLDRFSNRSEIEVTTTSEHGMTIRHGEAIVHVTASHFDYEAEEAGLEEAGLWCTLDGNLFRDKSTYGLMVVMAEILASKLGGRIVDEVLWLGRGRYVPCEELKHIVKRFVGDRISEQSLGNLALELNMVWPYSA